MAAVTSFIAATSCSPIFISSFAIMGSVLAHSTNRISPFTGTFIGVLVASFIPATVVPLMAEIVFICAAGLAFLASIAAKQGLRAYHQYRYGLSNADGYQMNREPDKQAEFIKSQAKKFNVEVHVFERVTTFCKNEIKRIKEGATFFEEFSGSRQPKTNSFKEIYHGLMNPDANTDAVVELLRESTTAKVAPANPRLPQIARMQATSSSGALRSDKQLRTLFHQANIYPGIDKSYVTPFTHGARM